MVETAAFEAFWKSYPRHVAKLAAQKAYDKARRMATPEHILAGVELYKRSKPPYADWCHPATWLNQGRWMDEPDTVAVQTERPFTAHELTEAREWYRRVGIGLDRTVPAEEHIAAFIRRRLRLEQP